MIVNDCPLFVSGHDLYFSINDIEIVEGYFGGREVNLISSQGPKARRSYLKKWARPINVDTS